MHFSSYQKCFKLGASTHLYVNASYHFRGIGVIGTGGVLITAKKQGLVDAVKPLLLQMKANGYRMSEALIVAILERCDEK